MNLRQVLSFSADKVYDLDDLDDDNTSDRALRLLFMAKFSPHIHYDKLPTTVAKSRQTKLYCT